jgi:hypothetical protein
MKKLLAISCFLCLSIFSIGQNVIPRLSIKNAEGNYLIGWNNPYTAVTAINIQRSADSLKNFITIGKVQVIKKGENVFIDNLAPAGNVFYRLFISFEGGYFFYLHLPRGNLLRILKQKKIQLKLMLKK